MEKVPPAITIFGVRIDNVDLDEALQRLWSFFSRDRGQAVATVNPEFLMEARKNDQFRDALNASALCVPDGIGIRSVCLLKNIRLKGRVAGADLFLRVIQCAAETSKRVFFFGAKQGIAHTAAETLKRRFPSLIIAGAENEYDPLGVEREMNVVLQRIRTVAPDILFVALGAPKQELWIRQHLERLPSVKVAVGVGGTFDFYAGKIKRAPRLFQRLGFEWLWRLFLQPRRLKRIVTATILFPLSVFTTRSSIQRTRV
ncbi:MAG: WecB/TagA/CpsF family glycosyltransferase [bacterium]